MEHKVCKDCIWNRYPECYGTIMDNKKYMNIENLRTGFRCGQKDRLEVDDLSFKEKTDLELKTEDLEERIKKIEEL